MSVRVRFAPSPTGYLHVGGLRTALYNYLFARHNGGKCILRIEDTDRTRLVENATESLIQSLHWAGIDFDESPVEQGEYGPYIQSERLSIYREHVNILLDKGEAYYAFDSSEDLDAMRQRLQSGADHRYDRMNMRNELTIGIDETKRLIDGGAEYVIRLKVPENQDIEFDDIIRGRVVVSSNEVDDQVLLKSDGFPTYHLANVVDDRLMAITHVIRGEEWLPSTPKHILLYKAFGWTSPEFAHLPLLLNADKTKLSKRQGSVAVEDFIDQGYFKEAFVNFIALLGWNPSADREIYTIEELIQFFALDKVNKAGAVFDRTKLEWMNFQYMKTKPSEELAEFLRKELEKLNIEQYSMTYLAKVCDLLRERVNFIREIPEYAPYLFAKPGDYDEEYKEKHWKENTKELLSTLIEEYRKTEEFTHDNTHEITKQFVEQSGIKLKDIIHPLRLMLTGRSVGAGMFETMAVLGKAECLSRFELFLEGKN